MPPQRTGQTTERTFYPLILDIIRDRGGVGVQEVTYNSEPDIVFTYLDRPWFMSVKIGEKPATVKDAFLQYLRHKEDSRIPHGLLLILPEAFRGIRPEAPALWEALDSRNVSVLVDAASVKEEVRDRPLPSVLDLIRTELTPLIARGERRDYSLPLVVSLMRAQVTQIMADLALAETDILRIITDRQLLTNLGHLEAGRVDQVGQFLAAYIALSQILFLRLFASHDPTVIRRVRPMTKTELRAAFNRILRINYRAIYEIDVLDAVPDQYLADTFDLVWGLEVERSRYELPGRLFHELMPPHIRKLLAAFYTRPQAAELLARLAIAEPTSTMIDPACGSGTILVAAYRAKAALWAARGLAGNPHKRFAEDEIYGADIMPFAVHLATANLSAIDVSQTLERTQIIQGDSLNLAPGDVRATNLQLPMFPAAHRATDLEGVTHDVDLRAVDTVLMNPPFTKVERGIARYVDMTRFRAQTGGEVGLWGHFVFLSDQFLTDGGTFGGVIPINVLRGRESERVRDFLTRDWTLKYVLKPTLNYGFSEWAEYRDVIVVCEKAPPPPDGSFKVALVKRDLTRVTDADIETIAGLVRDEEHLRSESLDIQSFAFAELAAHRANAMWFIGVSDLRSRDVFVDFVGRFAGNLDRFPGDYFREGYRPVPKGVSSVVFATRGDADSPRTQEAFLRFTDEDAAVVKAQSPLGATYRIDRRSLVPSLRTPIGLQTMDFTGQHDYLATEEYGAYRRVARAASFSTSLNAAWWEQLRREAASGSSLVGVTHRINPYSPNTHLSAHFSAELFSTSNQLNVVRERDPRRAKALCALLNSALFWSYFFLLKEESTGRYINVRFYDLAAMALLPRAGQLAALGEVFEAFGRVVLPSLREQFDQRFDERYADFWSRQARSGHQLPLFEVGAPDPHPTRLALDLAIADALGVAISEDTIRSLYQAIIAEMIITRGLTSD